MASIEKYLFFFFLFFFSFVAAADENGHLKTQDVHRIMQQIFEQHVDKKDISPAVIKNSFSVFIEQFDPQKIYLLDNEVKSFLNPTDSQLRVYVDQYKKSDYRSFQMLNEHLQKAIERSRLSRDAVIRNPSLLNQETNVFNEKYKTYALTPQELQERTRNLLALFMKDERRRFGEDVVDKRAAKILTSFDKRLRSHEDQYLYVNDEGKPFTPVEKEHYFVMHVLKALASSLDAHTDVLDPTEAYDMRVRLEKGFQGVGIIFEERPQGIYIAKLIEGGPAAKSGQLKVNDQVLEINGKTADDMSTDQLLNLVRGPKGGVVAFKIMRIEPDSTGKIQTVNLTRAEIIVNEDRAQYTFEKVYGGIIGKITLKSFYQSDNGLTSENDIREAIKKLQNIGELKGLILDFRENSGGFLSQAIKVAGLFITNGIVVISKYSDGNEKIYRDMDGKMAYDGPLIILTSKATASAAEIVAQALQDYGIAIIVGDDRTYGKGTIQTQTITEGNAPSYFKVTVGKYYTVSGKTPQMYGVKADIVVPSPFARETIGEEFLEYSLKQDTIPAEYKDDLEDVTPALRPWYMKYYMPTVQQQKLMWRKMLPFLRKNSALRMEHNSDYQSFIKGERPAQVSDKDRNVEEMQMVEAVNIVQDVLKMEQQIKQQATVENHSIEKKG